MRIKRLVLFLVMLLFVCAIACAFSLERHFKELSSSYVPSPMVKQPPLTKRYPVRIKIPAIQLDAAIEVVGITHEGAMDVPDSITEVGWYQFGSVPGNIGSAVMDGHIDGKNGEEGIFAFLHLLSPGDKVYIVDNKDVTTTFIVTKTTLYSAQNDSSAIFNQTAGSHLNLITCSGTWDKSQQSYNKRIVIFTDLLP